MEEGHFQREFEIAMNDLLANCCKWNPQTQKIQKVNPTEYEELFIHDIPLPIPQTPPSNSISSNTIDQLVTESTTKKYDDWKLLQECKRIVQSHKDSSQGRSKEKSSGVIQSTIKEKEAPSPFADASDGQESLSIRDFIIHSSKSFPAE